MCVTVNRRCTTSNLKDIFTFLATFAVRRLVADHVAWLLAQHEYLVWFGLFLLLFLYNISSILAHSKLEYLHVNKSLVFKGYSGLVVYNHVM